MVSVSHLNCHFITCFNDSLCFFIWPFLERVQAWTELQQYSIYVTIAKWNPRRHNTRKLRKVSILYQLNRSGTMCQLLSNWVHGGAIQKLWGTNCSIAHSHITICIRICICIYMNPPVTGDSPNKGPVMWGSRLILEVSLNKLLKQSRTRWF